MKQDYEHDADDVPLKALRLSWKPLELLFYIWTTDDMIQETAMFYLGLRLPWFRGRSWTRKAFLFLLCLVLKPPFAYTRVSGERV